MDYTPAPHPHAPRGEMFAFRNSLLIESEVFFKWVTDLEPLRECDRVCVHVYTTSVHEMLCPNQTEIPAFDCQILRCSVS